MTSEGEQGNVRAIAGDGAVPATLNHGREFLCHFLPLSPAVHFALPRAWRNLWITVASYVFYGGWEPWFIGLMMFTTVRDFIWGKLITRASAKLSRAGSESLGLDGSVGLPDSRRADLAGDPIVLLTSVAGKP